MNKFALAGRELMKGNIGNAIVSLATKSYTSELVQPSRWRNGNFFFGVNGADKAFIWGNFNSSLVAYQQCPVVSSIINKKAQCNINGIQAIMDLDGKESLKPQAIALRKLLAKPNKLQSSKQFKAQSNVYKQIYGYCPILIMKPVGFENDISRWSMWNIPPWMLQLVNSQSLFYESDAKMFDSIRLTYMGHSVTLDPETVFFLKENTISTGTYMYNSSQPNVSISLPDSRLISLEKPIDNLISSLNSRGSLIREKGPLWLLTNDSSDSEGSGVFPNEPKQVSKLEEDFAGRGIMRGQSKAIITDAKLKLQTFGFDAAQLKLLEGEIQDAKFISDALNYPPYLLGLVDAKFDNQQIAERNLYTNSIIPDAQSDDEQWMQLFDTASWGGKIITDYSHLPALQENIAEQGKGRFYMNQGLLIEFKNNLLTWNRWQELLGEDTRPGMDKLYYELLAEGFVFGDVPNQPLPNETNTVVTNG